MSSKFGAIIGNSEKTTKEKSSTYVTLEMFEQYHKRLMEYIGMHDDLIMLGYTTCPKCGATIKNDKCDKCSNYNFEEDGLTD